MYLSTGGKSFTYDSENHLMTMTATGTSASIVYDGDGNRVAKSVNGVTTLYLVDDLDPTGYAQVVEELTANGTVERQYTYGLQRISENQPIENVWTPSFYGYDGGGNVRNLTNSAGTVTDKYEYDAFGNKFTVSGSTPNNYLYRGEQYDSDLGLYYLRARYYNPLTGRFMSRDPEEFCNCSMLHPNEQHRYIYGNDDPTDLADPTGRAANPWPLPGPEPVPPPEYEPVKPAPGLVDYALIVAGVALTTVAASERVAERVNCVLFSAADTLKLAHLGDVIPDIANCIATGSSMPVIPRDGAVPAPFIPLDVITEPGTKWDCDASFENCQWRCPNGNTASLHYDPGIKYGEGPHWDYKDCDGKTWKIWPNGTMTPA